MKIFKNNKRNLTIFFSFQFSGHCTVRKDPVPISGHAMQFRTVRKIPDGWHP